MGKIDLEIDWTPRRQSWLILGILEMLGLDWRQGDQSQQWVNEWQVKETMSVFVSEHC